MHYFTYFTNSQHFCCYFVNISHFIPFWPTVGGWKGRWLDSHMMSEAFNGTSIKKGPYKRTQTAALRRLMRPPQYTSRSTPDSLPRVLCPLLWTCFS